LHIYKEDFMMKRKFFAIVLSALMAMSLVACGDKDATASTQEQPKTETTLATTNTVAETPKVETEKPKEEVTKESTEEASTEATVEETKPEETKPEEPKTETTTQAESSATASTESTSVETQAAAPSGTLVTNGKFNVDQFAADTGAQDFMMDETVALFLYDNTWIVEISSDIENPNKAFISVGRWETDRQDRWNINYYSCVFDFNTKVQITSADYPEYTWNVSQSALDYLLATVNAMKANTQFDTAPAVPGVTFKACQYNDPFVQN
jgi:hypothetical protein